MQKNNKKDQVQGSCRALKPIVTVDFYPETTISGVARVPTSYVFGALTPVRAPVVSTATEP